jgi:dihydropyrimidinase
MSATLILRDCSVAGPRGTTETDVTIRDGRIVSLERQGASALAAPGSRTLDVGRKLLLPGGVDTHVHLGLKGALASTSDDFRSGSLAALYGGTTALADFVTPRRGQGLALALDERLAEAAASVLPVKLHMGVCEWRDSMPGEMRTCVERGVGTFKIYLAYLETIGLDAASALKALEAARDLGAKVLVHAEEGARIVELQRGFASRGQTAPRYHALSRPPELEARSVGRIVEAVEAMGGPSVVFVHVSSAASMRLIIEAKAKGLPVYAETCPQYLAFTAEKYEAPGNRGALFVMSPPLRERGDVEFLWDCVAKGQVDFISTDHCPFDSSDKMRNAGDFMKIPNGAGGIAERMAFMISEGHVRRKIPIGTIVDACAHRPAAFYGFAPGAGTIEVGAPADLCVWDTSKSYPWRAALSSSACDYSPYEGMAITATPELVLLGGEIVARNWKPETKVGGA